jgi:hypothetical protein
MAVFHRMAEEALVTSSRKTREQSYRGIQIATLLYAALFMLAIGWGYYLLFAKQPVLGALLGIVLAGLALSFARFLGNEENGIKRFLPLFLGLLIVSAAGIFNNFMLTFEGKRIFSEAVSSAEDQFAQLRTAAEKKPQEILKVEEKIAEITAEQTNLIAELENPANCGQGPAAIEIMARLKKMLPNFTALTRRGGNPCANINELIDSYKSTIPELYRSTSWYQDAGYGAWLSDYNRLLAERTGSIPLAKNELARLRADVNVGAGATLVTRVKPELERLDAVYRDSLSVVRKYSDTPGLPPELSLLSVRSVGEWSQLPNLILDRLGKPTTYLYLALAIFADWLMIYLFKLLRERRMGIRPTAEPAGETTGILRS